MTTFLVTGAAGTVGKKVAAKLSEAGESVRAGVRSPETAADLGALGVEAVKLDFEDEGTLQAALSGVDRVFLLTPYVENPLPWVEAATRAAQAAGVSFVLRMSAAGADPDSEFVLARHHGQGEQIVQASGIPWTVIRPTFFQDNVMKYQLEAVRSQGAFYGAAGQGRTSYVSSDDVAGVAAAILRDPSAHESKTYVLTGGEAFSDFDVASMLSEVAGREISYVDLPPEQLAEGMKSQGTPDWQIAGLVGLEHIKRQGWAEAVSPAVSDILGRAPENFQDFLRRHAEILS